MAMNRSSDLFFDAIIIGGGPAGLSAALLLCRSCRQVIVIDAGHPRNAAARELHGFLSRDGISPADLRKAGHSDLSKYGCEVHQDVVHRVEQSPSFHEQLYPTAFRVETAKGLRLSARKLLFATGMRDELPDFPCVRECYGASVHHCPYLQTAARFDVGLAGASYDGLATFAPATPGGCQSLSVLHNLNSG
jgi:thioredoxin reductase